MTTTHTPRRIQRSRQAGWRAPLDPQGRRPVYVGRGTRWGNPWVVAATSTGWAVNWAGSTAQQLPWGYRHSTPAASQREAHAIAAEQYGDWLWRDPQNISRVRRELAGRDVMCWCPLDLPCHADELLVAAGATPGPDNGGAA